MKHLFTRIFLLHLLLIGVIQVTTQNEKSGNPILPRFHANPEVLYSRQTKYYHIYPTSNGFPGWGGSYFKIFSSKNLKTWEERTVILEMGKNVSWANGNAWTPCIEEEKISGKYGYFFYHSANPATNRGKQIGVVVVDSPTGPFIDLDKPITTSSLTGRGQQIDVDVFTDPVSSKNYLYWGSGHMAGAELNDDMLSIKEETTVVLIPKGGTLQTHAYHEAPYVTYRKGVHYFFQSINDTGSPNYHVVYGTAQSPLGPIKVVKEPIVLIQNSKEKIYEPVHDSILQVPGKDEWYIVYHRINKNYLNNGPGWHHKVCIDRIEFNPDGTIKRVILIP